MDALLTVFSYEEAFVEIAFIFCVVYWCIVIFETCVPYFLFMWMFKEKL